MSVFRFVFCFFGDHAASAIAYYKRAAELGDKRASQRLKGSTNQPIRQPGGHGSILYRDGGDVDVGNVKGKECVIM